MLPKSQLCLLGALIVASIFAFTTNVSYATDSDSFGISESSDEDEKEITEYTKNGLTIRYVKDEVLVVIDKDKIDLKDKGLLENIKMQYFSLTEGLSNDEEIFDQNVIVYKITDGTDPIDKIKELKENSFIKSASLNIKYESSTISGSLSNDEYKAQLWGLDNTGQTVNSDPGTADADIDWPEAMRLETGNDDVIVAVIDEGVDYTHPELSDSMWDGTNCLDESGNALGSCNHGYDFEDDDTTPLPNTTDDDHGTHIAGTIGAKRNNETGMLGITPRVKIMAIKTDLTSDELIKAYNFARYNGAKVINASYGASWFNCDSVFVEGEYDAIEAFPGLFVAAAGNDGLEHDGENVFGYSDWGADTECWDGLDNFIAVAATDNDDDLASFSDYGSGFIHLGAPGVEIYSTVNDETYEFKDGTSMATPHVAASAAFLWSYNDDASVSDVKDSLLNYGDTFGDPEFTISGRRLNLYNSLFSFMALYADDDEVDVDFSDDKKGSKYRYGTKIDLSMDDDRVNSIEYRWDNKGDWKVYKDKFTVKEGKNRLYVRALDGNRNTVAEYSKEIKAEESDLVYDLRAEQVNNTDKSTTIKWNSRSDDVSKFMVYRIVNNALGVTTYKKLITVLDPGERDYTDKFATDAKSQKVYYKVSAYNDEGEKKDFEEIAVDLPWSTRYTQKVPATTTTPNTKINLTPKPGDSEGISSY